MKNYLLLTASAVLVLSSCSNNEIVENKELKNGEPKKMSISAYVPGMTRLGNYSAVETTEAMFKEAGFTLVTDQFEDGEMFRTQMAFNSENNVWGPAAGEAEPAWPANPTETVEFFGVYPADAIGEGLQNLGDDEYALAFDGSVERDLMIAHASESYVSSTNGAVSLDFSHVLAKVEVRFTAVQEGYGYEVGKVQLTAPKATEYSFRSQFNSEADSLFSLDTIDEIDGASFKSEGGNISGQEVRAGDTVSFVNMMVVPGECTLNLGYKIAPQNQLGDQEIQECESIPFTAVAGRRNIVIITLSPSDKAMTFNVSVAGWEDGNTTKETLEL